MSATVFYNAANELASVSNTFSVDGVATDPTEVTLVITDPDGVQTTYTYSLDEITKTGTGSYTKDVSCASTNRGVWVAVWTGTEAAVDTAVSTWTTYDTAFQKLYCTPEELKNRVGISDNLDDAQILAACSAVSRWIDKECDRVFYRRTATRTFETPNLYCVELPDLVSVSTFKTDSNGDGTYDVTWSASDYQLLPADAAGEAEPEPYTEVKAVGAYLFPAASYGATARRNRLQIAGVWGWPATPEDIKQAAAIFSADLLKLGGMAFGVAGYGEYGPVRARPNPIVVELIAPYRRNPILVA